MTWRPIRTLLTYLAIHWILDVVQFALMFNQLGRETRARHNPFDVEWE